MASEWTAAALGIAILVVHAIMQGDRRQHDEREDPETEGVRHVLKERVVGVVLIGLGSLLTATVRRSRARSY